MSKRDDIGFTVDERTDVPTFEEVSSTMKRKGVNIGKRIKYFLFIVLLIGLVGGIGTTAYTFKDNIQNSAGTAGSSLTGFATGSITGFMTNDIDYLDKNKFGYEIKEVKINLTNEEQTLKTSLTQSLSSTCEQQKGLLATDIRKQEETECTIAKNALEAQVDTWKDKYTACNEADDDDE